MRKLLLPLLFLAAACTTTPQTGSSQPDLGWLITSKAPHTLTTKVNVTGPVTFELLPDLSLMSENPQPIMSREVTIGADSVLTVKLGKLAPGFYQARVADSIVFNIGIKPEEVLSPPDAEPDFDAFWEQTLEEVRALPMDAVLTEMPAYSDSVRTCYEVRYTSLGGAAAGGVISIPNAPGKYPVFLEYMGYGADIYYFDPQASPDRINFLVSVRNQGLFRDTPNWFDRGLQSKEEYYYHGAFADVQRAIDFACSLEKADPERVVAQGESQGGAFTLIAAAIDKRIKAAAPAVPFLGDYRDYAKIVEWPVHEGLAAARAQGIADDDYYRLMSYFDVKNFAPRITCPLYMAFGLQDPTCPPHTNFAIYNNLGTTDKHYLCVPTCGHAMWLEPAWPPIREAFFKSVLGLD